MSSLPIYVYVDVDDTFVRSASSKPIPMPRTIQHIRALKEQGAVLYCWSSGGADYARQSADEFGIANCFEAFLPKPNVLLDDMAMTAWGRGSSQSIRAVAILRSWKITRDTWNQGQTIDGRN